tara:strand:- start:444 stop:656 length:213 start_codon:yes stop_codon:yes gene_type:complete
MAWVGASNGWAIHTGGELPGYAKEARYSWELLHSDDDMSLYRWGKYLIIKRQDTDQEVIMLMQGKGDFDD